jgi:hypothetical protein
MRTFASTEGLQGGLVSQRELSGLDNKLETSVDRLLGLLLHSGRAGKRSQSERIGREKVELRGEARAEQKKVIGESRNVLASWTPFFSVFERAGCRLKPTEVTAAAGCYFAKN